MYLPATPAGRLSPASFCGPARLHLFGRRSRPAAGAHRPLRPGSTPAFPGLRRETTAAAPGAMRFRRFAARQAATNVIPLAAANVLHAATVVLPLAAANVLHAATVVLPLAAANVLYAATVVFPLVRSLGPPPSWLRRSASAPDSGRPSRSERPARSLRRVFHQPLAWPTISRSREDPSPAGS